MRNISNQWWRKLHCWVRTGVSNPFHLLYYLCSNRFRSRQIQSPSHLECLLIQVSAPKPLFVCLVYIPPCSDLTYYPALFDFISVSTNQSEVVLGSFKWILFSQTKYCAHRTISFLSFHTFFIVHRSVLTAENLIKVKAQQSF